MKSEKRILIVEDDDAIRTLVETVLRRRGYRVETARNGIEALERMHAAAFSLIILDLMMPRMSGYELLEHLATHTPLMRPLVLVLTAGIEPKPFDTTLVIGTVHKPFDIDLLVDIVRGCLATPGVAETVIEELGPIATPMPETRPN